MNPLDSFLSATRAHITQAPDPYTLTHAVALDLEALIERLGWDFQADCAPGDFYGRLLFEDPHTGFIAVAMVWGSGAQTPIHDHGTWGVFGVTGGALEFTNFVRAGGDDEVAPVAQFEGGVGAVTRLVAPEMEIHRIRNAGQGVARSLHVYGRNIGF